MRPQRQPPGNRATRPFCRRVARNSVLEIRHWLFLILCFVAPCGFCQSQTNALPKLLPPDGLLPPTFWEQHGTSILARSLAFLALAAIIVWQILKRRPARVAPPDVVARQALAQCRGRPETEETLAEVSQTLRRYICAALHLPGVEFTTAEFTLELEISEMVPLHLARAIADFLHACDERRFSRAPGLAPLNAVSQALEFIALTKTEIRRQEASATQDDAR